MLHQITSNLGIGSRVNSLRCSKVSYNLSLHRSLISRRYKIKTRPKIRHLQRPILRAPGNSSERKRQGEIGKHDENCRKGRCGSSYYIVNLIPVDLRIRKHSIVASATSLPGWVVLEGEVQLASNSSKRLGSPLWSTVCMILSLLVVS
jgi:hypothetical protein